METLIIPPPPTPGSPPGPPSPPVNVSSLPLGFDIYQSNGPAPPTVDDFRALKAVGKIFGIHKVAQGAIDTQFDVRYPLIREAGLIRGCYDFFAPLDVNTQVGWVVAHVQRLTPGDLAPAIDLEDQSEVLNAKYKYSSGTAGRQSLFNDVMAWLNGIEKQLGRIPLIYTGVIWREQFSATSFPALPDMNAYPLMTAHPILAVPNPAASGEVFNGWSDYAIWQYAENKRKGEDGSQQWGLNPYLEPGTKTFDGIDYDAFNGTIYSLRGLADIGRPGIALNGSDPYIAHSEIDGHIHLLAQPGGWTDSDLGASGSLVAGGEDPVLMSSSGSLYLYFRSEGHLIEAILPSGSSDWEANQIEDATLIHDPRVALDGDKRFAVYWADDDDWYLMTFDGGAWTNSGGILRAANLGRSTGQPAVYVTQGVPHVTGRVDLDGDLLDLWPDGNGGWRNDNVSALARDLAPTMPAATYSPCAYETNGGVGIVFRAVGGHLWLVTRNDNAPTDLTAATQASVALGHPSSFVMQDTPHIVFRGVDHLIHEIWPESGSWHLQQVCDATAASDPVATTNGTLAQVAFRGSDGMVYTSQFDGTGWSCGATTMANISGQGGPIIGEGDGSGDSSSSSDDSSSDSDDSSSDSGDQDSSSSDSDDSSSSSDDSGSDDSSDSSDDSGDSDSSSSDSSDDSSSDSSDSDSSSADSDDSSSDSGDLDSSSFDSGDSDSSSIDSGDSSDSSTSDSGDFSSSDSDDPDSSSSDSGDSGG